MALDGNERRDLYRKMLNDPATQGETRKYSFVDWEKKLLGDEKAIGKLAQFAVNKNWAIDESDFAERYIPEAIQAPPAPKPQPIPVAPAPVEEEEAYIPEPPPVVGSPAYDVQLQAQYGGMAPTLGATFAGTPAAFETKEQKKQEQISPAFKAQQLAFEDVPIAEEQRRAQRQFAKATKQQQQAALQGGPGYELEQEKKAKKRELSGTASDLIGSWSEGGKRIAKNILSYGGYLSQTQAATDPMANLPYEKRQEMMQEAGQTLYDNAADAQNTFQDEIAKRNIQTSVLQAIDKGQYSRIPEAVLYTVGDAAMQIIPSILTFGGSTYFQTIPQVYKEGVDAIAKEKGISPEQVVASGEDAFIVSQINGGIQTALEYAGAGLVSKGIASKGGYKAMRDWLLSQNVNRKLAQGAALLGVGIGEGTTEYFQEMTGQTGKTAAKSPTAKAFFEKIPNEIFTPEARRQREEAFVGGLVGGLGLAGGGQAIQSAMDRTLFEAPKIGKATQRPDMDVVQADNKIQERNKIAQAMEEAVKANPEAEGQIRQQYQKRINEAAPKDDEVLNAYKSLSALPETEEKNAIQENLEAYMAEKGIAPQEEVETVSAEELQGPGFQIAYAKTREEIPQEYRGTIAEVERPTTRLGRFGPMERLFAYRVPVETIDITAPEVTTEEDLAEDIPFEEVPDVTEEAPAEEEELSLEDQLMLPEEEAAPAPAEEEVVAEETVSIAPLNIDFTKNEGRNVNYQGIEGRIKIDSDGAPYVFTKDGDVVYIEGGLSGQTPQQLGVQPLADDVINEADLETVLEDETAPLDQNQLQYDFDNNTITLYGKPFTYEGVETNSKGQTTALRLRDANGKVKFVRNEDTILEFEIQKELYEKSRTNKPATIESATAAAEQLQVVPVARIEQAPQPVQQERSTGNIEGNEIVEAVPAPAPKAKKEKAPKPAPVTPPAAPKAQPVAGKKVKEMSLEELQAESSLFDEKIKAEEERLNKTYPNRPRYSGAGIDNLSPEDAARYAELNDEIGRRQGTSQEEAKRRVAEKREQRRKEQEAPKEAQKPIEFGKKLEEKYGVRVDLLGRLDKGDLTLSRIEVPKGQREKGIGTKVMEEITKYADENGKRIILSPTKEFGATSVDRLRAFYKGFGFVENKGNNKDFTIKELMYRLPSVEAKPTTGIPQEGDAVEIAPAREGGSSRKMVFKDGEWKQEVGGEIVKVGPPVQQQAQEAFSGKTETKAEETKPSGFRPKTNAYYYISKGADEVFYTLREIAGDDLDVHVMNLSKDLADSKQKAKELVGGDVEFDEASLGRDYKKIKANKTGKGQKLAQRQEGEGAGMNTLSFGKYNGKTIDEVFEIDKPYILYLNKEYSNNTVFQKGVRDNPKIKEFINQSLSEKEGETKRRESLPEIGGVKFDEKGVAKGVPIKGKIKYINNRMGPQGFYKVYIVDTEYGIPVEVSGTIESFADGKLEQGTELSFTGNVQKVGDKFKVIGKKSEYKEAKPAPKAPETKPAEEGKKANPIEKTPVKPSPDDPNEVADAIGNARFVGNKKISIDKLVGGVDLSQKSERARVDKLIEKITSDDGYIARIVVDQNGNVLEGQHRLEALREIGATDVPVSVVEVLSDVVSVADLEKAIDAVQSIGFYQKQDLIKNFLEILADEKQDIQEVKLYEEPSGYQKAWRAMIALYENAASKEVAPQPSFTSKQESSASTEFDGTKKPSKIKTKSFDGKHGKGAFQRMKNITDNFEDIMDGLSEKIKQDCL
jgi:GNAT superfamily N-acetyltransferase